MEVEGCSISVSTDEGRIAQMMEELHRKASAVRTAGRTVNDAEAGGWNDVGQRER